MDQANKTLRFSIIGNIGVAIIKGLAGVLGNSYALLSDCIESIADVFSSLIVLLGLRYSNKPPDKDHPYGHGRAEPLITLVVVGTLIAAALVIAKESIDSFKEAPNHPKIWTLALLAVLIVWKEYSYRKVMEKAIELNSTSMKGEAWHHRSDAITSVAAFVGIVLAQLGGIFERADAWAALFASVFILYNSYSIFRPALAEIMDEHNHHDLVNEIRNTSLMVSGIMATDKCHIRKAGMKYHVDLHIWVDGNITVTEGHAISHDLKDLLVKEIPSIENVLIHIEPHP